MESFADRLWWARHRKGLGANKLAQAVGFSQSLLSSLETTNANRSKYNDQLAKVLEVDPEWLRTGGGQAPEGFDPSEATKGREAAVALSPSEARQASTVVRLQARANNPRWAVQADAPSASSEPALMKTLINTVMDLARLVGPDRTKAMVEVAARAADLVSQNPVGHDEVGSPN